MIETIPNPLQDKGVLRDIDEKVGELMGLRSCGATLAELAEKRVRQAAEWGISQGFRMGWRVYEVTGGKG